MTQMMTRQDKSRQNAAQDIPGLAADCIVLTLAGEKTVRDLTVGDRIITRSGARSLRGIQTRMIDNAVMIKASALGHDRPEQDMIVAPGQRLHIRDWRAKALYGQDVAQVEVERLADGDYIAPAAGQARVYMLEFDEAEVIYAGGIEVVAPARVLAAV